jgi:hypothetical protein
MKLAEQSEQVSLRHNIVQSDAISINRAASTPVAKTVVHSTCPQKVELVQQTVDGTTQTLQLAKLSSYIYLRATSTTVLWPAW